MTQLALKYRPRTFQDLVGQGPVQVVLYHMVRKGLVPHALLFSGQRGCGKTSTARILAAALNCREWDRSAEKPLIPCGECASCREVEDGCALDVLEVDAASNGGVAEIRKLKDITQFSPSGDFRVVVLDEAHSMSGEAFNALLKQLEEPPPRTVFALLTTEPSKIMPTVASRCHQFTFRRIPPAVIAKRLRHIADAEGRPAADDLLAAIARRSDGAMRDAVMALDQATAVGIADARGLAALHGETDWAPVLLTAMAGGDHAQIFAALDAVLAQTGEHSAVAAGLVSCLRDVLVLASGGDTGFDGPELEARRQLAKRLTKEQAVAVMRVMWELRAKVRGLDPRSALELAVVVASDRVAPVAAPKGNGNGSGARMTAEDMRQMVATQ